VTISSGPGRPTEPKASPARPVILPVQYRVAGHRLVVCLGHHAIPDRSLNHAVVAFTADAIDIRLAGGQAPA